MNIPVALLSIVAQVPDSDPVSPGGDLAQDAGTLIGIFKWGGLVVCALALIVAACSIAMSFKRHEGVESFGGVPKVMVAVALISGGISMLSLFA